MGHMMGAWYEVAPGGFSDCTPQRPLVFVSLRFKLIGDLLLQPQARVECLRS